MITPAWGLQPNQFHQRPGADWVGDWFGGGGGGGLAALGYAGPMPGTDEFRAARAAGQRPILDWWRAQRAAGVRPGPSWGQGEGYPAPGVQPNGNTGVVPPHMLPPQQQPWPASGLDMLRARPHTVPRV